ncbi:DUF4081 domain-containing GNAT family N-acetyltransferase [Paraoerskovia marina]|uniref:N-acetyltransferase domain-containing protein n=1 Tax=Paraoerskovia marina TaxID=545619 RepID=A0A1H1TZ84_9CELL|nr:DUF4081 domain-containing GNAT family N-acetyltransferase [Paraoerskovia marina]SDS65605.1 hypothetical protein SAMN04489860_2045 [Paraoerskovia marina]
MIRPPVRDEARVLRAGDLAEALAVCAVDPVASVLAAARLEVARRSGLTAAGGEVWGYPAAGALTAICWAGANLVPVVPDGSRAALDAFARRALRHGRRSSSIVGERAAALGLWERLAHAWPAAREVRDEQPSLAIDGPPAVAPDPRVRRAVLRDMPVLLPACVRMFTEEVGYSPMVASGGAYEQRVRSLVRDERSFVRPLHDGPSAGIGFKAEVGALTSQVAQIQGVWVEPRVRGQGLSVPGMAAVVHHVRAALAPVVSLYVNAWNEPALRAYHRVGFERVGTYATILF